MKIIVKKCVSLVFVLLTIAMLCMCAAFFVACDDEPTDNTFDETKSQALYLDEAYELGLLSDDDLMSIAYYYHDHISSSGRTYNEEVIPEDFVPAAKDPGVVRYDVYATIADAYLEICDETMVEEDSPYAPYVRAYCGTYGKCVAVVFCDGRLSEEQYYDSETGEYSSIIETVGDLHFSTQISGFPLVWYMGDSEPSDLTYPGISLEFDTLVEAYYGASFEPGKRENFIAACDTYEEVQDVLVSHGFDVWEDESIEEYMAEYAGEKSLIVCEYSLSEASGPYSIYDIKVDGDEATMLIYYENRTTVEPRDSNFLLIAGVDSSAISGVTDIGTVFV